MWDPHVFGFGVQEPFDQASIRDLDPGAVTFGEKGCRGCRWRMFVSVSDLVDRPFTHRGPMVTLSYRPGAICGITLARHPSPGLESRVVREFVGATRFMLKSMH